LIVTPTTAATTEIAAIPRGVIAAGAGRTTLIELIATRRRTGRLIITPTTAAATEIAAIASGVVAARTGCSALVELSTSLADVAGRSPVALIVAGAAATGRAPFGADCAGHALPFPLARSPSTARGATLEPTGTANTS